MDKIRVLVVDDSMVVRRALRECFRGDPEIEVVGVAETGVRALQQIDDLKPDLVTLDIEMPEMDGLETLRFLRARGSQIPIIMFSRYTRKGAQETIKALELGASDVVEKPVSQPNQTSACEAAKRQLTTRIRALGRKARKVKAVPSPTPEPRVPQAPNLSIVTAIDAVAIAISTGGPSALIEVVSGLDAELPVPIFITQHMPPMFTKFLAERLTVRGRLPAVEAEEGMPVVPGTIYIAPGDFHLELAQRSTETLIHLSQAPAENSCRPSADVMFRSLADVYGAGLLGIVMTGMGQDGRRGSEEIRSRGGLIVAQDEASSLVWGMPRAVITAELHNAVAPLSGISTLINNSCKKGKQEN
jgi:two-component system chemotaxis response regulator CheB